MFTTPEFIQAQGTSDFACYLKGSETSSYHVEFGKLEKTPEISDLSAIRDNMNEMYGIPSPTEPVPEVPKEAEIEPSIEQGSGEDTPELTPESEDDGIEQEKW